MDSFELVVGTYENLILGYKFVNNLDGSHGLQVSFTDDSHRGSLRCLCVSPSGTLVSSSTDDSVRLHSLVRRKEIGGLFEHTGTVNCITFFKRSHMFTASEDKTICMWKSRNWEMLRVLKGHKSHVMAVAVHPTGKLGLSVGSDRSLLTWDFVTGKLAFQRKITQAAQNVLFTSSGDHYILVYQKKIEVCSLQDTKAVQEVSTDWRINGVCFLKDEILAVAGDHRFVLLIDILTGKQILNLDMARSEQDSFTGRVRCICATVYNGHNLLTAATADGNIKVFKIDLPKKSAEVVLFYEARVRLTCMTVYNSLPCSKDEEGVSDVRESRQVKKSANSEQKNPGRPEERSDTEIGDSDERGDSSPDTGKISTQEPNKIKQGDESDSEDGDDAIAEDSKKPNPHSGGNTRKRKQEHSSRQKQRKRRRLQVSEAQKSGKSVRTETKVKKFSEPSDVSQTATGKHKKLKKKKTKWQGK